MHTIVPAADGPNRSPRVAYAFSQTVDRFCRGVL
jgi:hypothetical protein